MSAESGRPPDPVLTEHPADDVEATHRISGDRFSAASAMNDWTRATRSSGSGVTPSRIMRVGPELQGALLDERRRGRALALRLQSRRIKGADGLTSRIRGGLGELLVGQLQHAAASGCSGRPRR